MKPERVQAAMLVCNKCSCGFMALPNAPASCPLCGGHWRRYVATQKGTKNVWVHETASPEQA